MENANKHIIHVRPSRSTPKTISQPFRGTYSGLRHFSGKGGCAPVKPHAIKASMGTKL